MPKVITYTHLLSDSAESLLQMVRGVVSLDQFESFRSIDGLKVRLSKSLYDVDVVILVVESKEILEEILGIMDLLRAVSVIIVLPDRDPETISKGYSVWPRFVSYTDSDLSEIAVVLEKMINKSVMSRVNLPYLLAGNV